MDATGIPFYTTPLGVGEKLGARRLHHLGVAPGVVEVFVRVQDLRDLPTRGSSPLTGGPSSRPAGEMENPAIRSYVDELRAPSPALARRLYRSERTG